MFRTIIKPATVIGLAILCAGAFAQFDDGSGIASKSAWDQLKLNPKTRIKLDFKNANIDLVIGFISKYSGITIVKDPALVGPISVSSATSVSLSTAFNILDSVLQMKGYSFQKKDNFLTITQGRGRNRIPSPPNTDNTNPYGNTPFQTPPKLELKVYPIQYASATAVARVINDVFTGQQQNPFQAMMGFGGGPGGPGGRAQRMAALAGAGSNTLGTVKASADDYSNSIIVNAAEKDQEQVADIIRQIDKQADAPTQSKVYKLDYAVASDLSTVVQNVLTQNAPKGKGQSTTQQNQGGFGGFIRAAFGQNQNNGQVVAESRTNSLVVTATVDNLKIIDQVVKELDKEVKFQPSTFVFPLQNARADLLATLLQQAFGNKTGSGVTSRTTTTPTGPFGQTINPNTGGTSGSSSGTGSRSLTGQSTSMDANKIDPSQLDLALQNPGADSGELLTQISAQGFGGFGGFGGGGGQRTGTSSSSTANTIGMDQSGKLVNVRDLTGQVTVIADPNTNSLIVVSLPENAELIKQILAQLDKIPQQVMIETIIVEASLDSSNQFGVEWQYVQNNMGGKGNTGTFQQTFGLQTATPAPTGFKFTMTGSNLTGFLNAMQADTKFQVLSTPRIFTANNSEAQINISQQIPYVLSTLQDVNGNLSYNYGFLNVGIILTVLPRITADGYVAMDITQTANDLNGYTSFNAPIVNQREATTSVAVKDGETIILGGIIRNQVTSTVNKIPLLGDIPFLGNLFKSTSKDKQKTELLVFLTPRVIRSPEEAKKLFEDSKKEMSPESRKGFNSAAPASARDVPPSQTDGKPKGGS